MLWLRTKIGQSVRVGESLVTLVSKNDGTIVLDVDGAKHRLRYHASKQIGHFTVATGSSGHGLRLGFHAEKDVPIRRSELET